MVGKCSVHTYCSIQTATKPQHLEQSWATNSVPESQASLTTARLAAKTLSTFFSLSLKQSQVSSGHEENLTLIRVIAGKGEKGKVELELSEIKRICKNKCFEYKQQTHSIMIILASPLTTPNHFMREKKPIKQISFHFRDSKASP